MKKIEESASDIVEKVNRVEGSSEFSATFQRMDEDFEMWALHTRSYPVQDYEVTTKQIAGMHDSDVDIVSNRPRTFSDQVQSTLSDAEMQIIIRMVEQEGEDKRDDIAKLERLLYFALDMADRRLRQLLFPPFREASIWYSIVRGAIAGETLVYKRVKDVIFHLMPLDPRWLTYEVGGDGLLWTAYKTWRSGAALKSEWGYNAKKNTDNEVVNYWRHDGEKKFTNAVICDKEWLKPPEVHEMRSFPVTIVPVATRPPVATITGSEAGGYGESIFAPLRGINKTRNRFMSIAATHANLLSKQPLINYRDEEGIELHNTAYFAESVLNLPMEHNKLEPAPMKELAPTVVELIRLMNDEVEDATLPHIPVGSPPPSGTLYNLVQEAGNKVFNPQLKNLSYLYQDICHKIEEQLIDSNIKVNVKHEEKKKYFEVEVTPVDLKKPHITKVEFTARTPWTQFDTYQIADMADRLGLPKAFIHEYILKLPDPKGLGDMSAIEMAEHSPKLAMVRAIEALGLAGRKDEAEQVMRDLYEMTMMEQRETMPATPASPTPAQMPTGMGSGGMR